MTLRRARLAGDCLSVSSRRKHKHRSQVSGYGVPIRSCFDLVLVEWWRRAQALGRMAEHPLPKSLDAQNVSRSTLSRRAGNTMDGDMINAENNQRQESEVCSPGLVLTSDFRLISEL